MQLKLDVKTLVIGILLGAAIAAAIGADIGSADAARFGIALEKDGSALVQTSDGSFLIVNPNSGMAVRVLEATTLKTGPDDSRNEKGRLLRSTGSDKSQKTSGAGY